MAGNLRLMLVLAHPDDESLGNGGTIAKYASEGVDIYLVTATRGEDGWFGPADEYPGADALGRSREAELREACAVLGVREVVFLGYRDGELASVDAAEAVARIGREIQRVRPDVVVTFDQNGLYGHPDHIAISRLTTTAVVAASQVDFLEAEGPVTHLVPKLYYMAWTQRAVALYESAFGELRMEVEGHTRQPSPWPDWALTTRIDASDHWRRAWEAIERHQSQLPAYDRLLELPAAFHRELWSNVGYYRALSLVNVVSDTEDDLFAGLR